MAASTIEAARARAEDLHRPAANRVGLWIFMVSETFLFAAVISARFVSSGTDRPEELNQALALALTCVLLASSIRAYLAESAMASGNRRVFLNATRLTIVLGLGFLGGVLFEWHEALEHFPPGTLYGSSFFALVGLHAFHVLTGVLALAVVLNLGAIGHYGPDDHWPVEGVVKYWHFVDLMWVVISPTLYLF